MQTKLIRTYVCMYDSHVTSGTMSLNGVFFLRFVFVLLLMLLLCIFVIVKCILHIKSLEISKNIRSKQTTQYEFQWKNGHLSLSIFSFYSIFFLVFKARAHYFVADLRKFSFLQKIFFELLFFFSWDDRLSTRVHLNADRFEPNNSFVICDLLIHSIIKNVEKRDTSSSLFFRQNWFVFIWIFLSIRLIC